MNPIIFLVSGEGGNLRFIYQAIKILKLDIRISLVIADRDCGAARFAIQNDIPFIKIDYSRNSPNQLTRFFVNRNLRVLSPQFIRYYLPQLSQLNMNS